MPFASPRHRWVALFVRAFVLACLPGTALTGCSGVPPINANRAGTNLVLSWPGASSNVVVESVNRLEISNSWTILTNRPLARGGDLAVTNAIAPGSKFYRLAEQFDFYGKPIRFVK